MWFRSWFDALGISTQPLRSRSNQRTGDRRRRETRRLFLEGLEERKLLTFLPAVDYPVDTNPLVVVTGDFNGDGHLDLATVNPVAEIQYESGTVSALLGDGAGGFDAAIVSSAGGYGHGGSEEMKRTSSLNVAVSSRKWKMR